MQSDTLFTRQPAETDRPVPYRQGKVVPPVLWPITILLLIAVVSLVAWCSLGTMVNTLPMSGVVFPQYGISQITSSVSGVVEYTQVEMGDNVQVGDLIAIVPQENLMAQIQSARAADPAADLSTLYTQYQNSSMIYTPVSGRVVEMVHPGAYVQAGDLIAGITNSNTSTNEQEIRAYVPVSTVQHIDVGMEVWVYPQVAIEAGSFLHLEGIVNEISSYPMTQTDIEEELGRFFPSQGLPGGESIFEVRVTVLSGGASIEEEVPDLEPGTQCEMQVVLSKLTPWEYITTATD